MGKKRKIEQKVVPRNSDDSSERTYEEKVREFRVNFLKAMNLSAKHWDCIFEDTIVDEDYTYWGEISIDDKIDLLLAHEENIIYRFENCVIDLYENDPSVSERMLLFLKTYFASHSKDIFFMPIVKNFFQADWEVFRRCKLQDRRKEDSKARSSCKPITHMFLENIYIPIDVVWVILSFLPHNRSLIGGLGCATEKWFRVVLLSWKHLVIGQQYLEIPILVMENVVNIRFSMEKYKKRLSFHETFASGAKYRIQTLDLSECFQLVNCNKLKKLDLSEIFNFHDFSILIKQEGLELFLPNLEVLLLGYPMHVLGETSDMKEKIIFKNLTRLKHLSVCLEDLNTFSDFFNSLNRLELLYVFNPTHHDIPKQVILDVFGTGDENVQIFPRLEAFSISYHQFIRFGVIPGQYEKDTQKLILDSFSLNCSELKIHSHSGGVNIHLDCVHGVPFSKISSLVLSNIASISTLQFPSSLKKLEVCWDLASGLRWGYEKSRERKNRWLEILEYLKKENFRLDSLLFRTRIVHKHYKGRVRGRNNYEDYLRSNLENLDPIISKKITMVCNDSRYCDREIFRVDCIKSKKEFIVKVDHTLHKLEHFPVVNPISCVLKVLQVLIRCGERAESRVFVVCNENILDEYEMLKTCKEKTFEKEYPEYVKRKPCSFKFLYTIRK